MITQNELKRILHYDPETGLFTRISRSSGARVGDIAGTIMKLGYIAISVKGKVYTAHRLAWLYIHGYFPEKHIDHYNHKRNDNRINNLREVMSSENHRNRSKSILNTSGIIGVRWRKQNNKWLSSIKVNGIQKHLGYFEDKFEAICARKSANNKYGFHPNHGN